VIHRRTFLIASAAGAALAIVRRAEADAVGDLFAEIAKVRASIKTATANFVQERTIGLLATAVKSDGEMALVRPDRLRWELKPPDAVTYWIGPEGFAYATPSGGASVGKQAAGRFAPVLGDMLVLFGGDLEKLRARYDITIASRSPDTVLHLVPRTDEVRRAVSSIDLTLGPELWTMKKVVMAEANGDKSVITFSNLKRDVPVDPTKMRPPK
jgi:outer membrane lipoprotein-sorting protein